MNSNASGSGGSRELLSQADAKLEGWHKKKDSNACVAKIHNQPGRTQEALILISNLLWLMAKIATLEKLSD